MADLPHETIRAALGAQPLFEAKTWRLSPEAWPLSAAQVEELRGDRRGLPGVPPGAGDPVPALGRRPEPAAQQAAPGALGRRLPRPGQAGGARRACARPEEPRRLSHRPAARPSPHGQGIRHDRARLRAGRHRAHRLPEPPLRETNGPILGAATLMVRRLSTRPLAALRPNEANPLVALVVSDEAATYRPEMEWLALQLQLQGKRVFALRPQALFPLGGALFFDSGGNPGEDRRHLPLLRALRPREHPGRAVHLRGLGGRGGRHRPAHAPLPGGEARLRPLSPSPAARLLGRGPQRADGPTAPDALIPPSWVMDPAPLPPGAVLDGPHAGGRAISRLARPRGSLAEGAGPHHQDQRIPRDRLGRPQRDSRQRQLARGMADRPWIGRSSSPRANLHLLQAYRKPSRVRHRVYRDGRRAVETDGRLRLCPYYLVVGGKARLSGALATFCPPDKKIIHGMQDAALLPCRIATWAGSFPAGGETRISVEKAANGSMVSQPRLGEPGAPG